MSFSSEIEIFIRDFVKDLNNGTASLFAGAGLSIPAGFVNWSELMKEIAEDLGLDISAETDLVSIAQYHVNENRTRSKLNRKILEEFVEDTEETENHRIIAKLPLASIWTTNYDQLIEKTIQKESKIVDVKYNNRQLLTARPKRDMVIYKMHGDVNQPSDAVITKEQYEIYHQTHEPFINLLAGELTTKTFLFIGFSFTDPNLDYVLSRLNYRHGEDKRQHYCIVKRHTQGDRLNPDKATLEYNIKKQNLIINDLKRYGIKTLLVDKYDEITLILREIENRFRKRTVFISGSAENYEPYKRNEALGFVHQLAQKIIENDFRIINGFGWGIGSSVINGALEAIYTKPTKFSESQLILKPFPQFKSGKKELSELWEQYRQKMISLSGISIFLFGNKLKDKEIINANGVIREFEISHERGNFCIPIACTSYAAQVIYEKIIDQPEKYYNSPKLIVPDLEKLADLSTSLLDKVDVVINLINKINQ